jgi:hypothetical protein
VQSRIAHVPVAREEGGREAERGKESERARERERGGRGERRGRRAGKEREEKEEGDEGRQDSHEKRGNAVSGSSLFGEQRTFASALANV